MRGKPARGLSRKGRPRIIPAHAGQTTWRSCAASNPADHPRACGANPLGQINVSGFAGSSPRMRGKLPLLQHVLHGERIIPAHAGQTHHRSCPVICYPDHPRACGANVRHRRSRPRQNGSSPRMRGKQGGRRKLEREIRIIPAHAGQTGRVSPCRNPCSDHPRACGANPIPPEKWKGGRGSSPRMRGKQREQLDFERVFRIIPAHAGQTTFLNKTLANPADHPRACGAN